MKLRTQYGDYIKIQSFALTMPSEIKDDLDAKLDAIKSHVGGTELSREFMWIPAHVPSKVDPLCATTACAGAKLTVEHEIDRDAYLAAVAADGWRPASALARRALKYEFRDIYIDGKPERYARPAEL